MKKILLLSDTHGYLDEAIKKHAKTADEIWHAGDIGSADLIEQLKAIKPLKAVFGNIDGYDTRILIPKTQFFNCEDVPVYMTHIGGYPGRYEKETLRTIKEQRPQLFISGHSHILKVIYDKKYSLLHINPGAIGKNGFHKVRTMVRFRINKNNIEDLRIIEYPR